MDQSTTPGQVRSSEPQYYHQSTPTNQNAPPGRDSAPAKYRLPEAYEFVEPQKLDGQRLEGKSTSKAADFAESRVKAIAKIMADLIRGEEKSHHSENDIISNAIAFIRTTLEECRTIIAKEQETKKNLFVQIEQNKYGTEDAEHKAHDAKQHLKTLEHSIVETKKHLIDLNEKKKQAAEEIINKFDQLRSIKIADPKNEGNDLFKWYLGVIYSESNTKYEFKNFKTETLKKDKGVDFANRLRGLKIFDLGKEEVTLTDKTLAVQSKVTEALNFKQKTALTVVPATFHYMQIVHDAAILTDKLHKEEERLEHTVTESDVAGVLFSKIRSRQEDIEASIGISDKAIQTFNRVISLLQKSEDICKKRQEFTKSKIPLLRQETVQPDIQAEFGQTVAEGGEEEEAEVVQGGTDLPEGVQKHARVQGGYNTNLDEGAQEIKEGCKCTIF